MIELYCTYKRSQNKSTIVRTDFLTPTQALTSILYCLSHTKSTLKNTFKWALFLGLIFKKKFKTHKKIKIFDMYTWIYIFTHIPWLYKFNFYFIFVFDTF